MDQETFEELYDALAGARRVLNLLPVLPRELTNSHMKVIHALHVLSRASDSGDGGAPGARVSDIASELRTTMPSITRLVHELEERGDVRKVPSPTDRRVINVELTDQGLRTYRFWIEDVHERAARALAAAGITAQEARETASTIERTIGALEDAHLQAWQDRRLAQRGDGQGA